MAALGHEILGRKEFLHVCTTHRHQQGTSKQQIYFCPKCTNGPKHRSAPAVISTRAFPPHSSTEAKSSPGGETTTAHHQYGHGWNTPAPQRFLAKVGTYTCWQLSVSELRVGHTHTHTHLGLLCFKLRSCHSAKTPQVSPVCGVWGSS